MTPKLVDIHCHLNFPDFNKDREETIKRTLDAGIWCINVGADLKTSEESIKLAEEHEGIFATTGCHPHYASEGFDTRYYKELARNEKVVAIGECGLDNIRSRTSNSLQREIFEKQIYLAAELNKPLMIHCRNAHEEVLGIVSKFKTQNSKLTGNVHFFTGKWDQAERYLEMGFMFSFTGLITYIRDLDKIIEKLPLDRIMAETDAPFVAPMPYRGERSEPLYVEQVVRRIAEIKNVSFEEVTRQTTQNAINFFGLKNLREMA
jgi:TatD DNase family protein